MAAKNMMKEPRAVLRPPPPKFDDSEPRTVRVAGVDAEENQSRDTDNVEPHGSDQLPPSSSVDEAAQQQQQQKEQELQKRQQLVAPEKGSGSSSSSGGSSMASKGQHEGGVAVDINENGAHGDEPKAAAAERGSTASKPSSSSAAELPLPPLSSSSSSSTPIAPPYKVPDWGERPGVRYSLEVLKDGRIIDKIDLSSKQAFMFGRSDRSDVVLEHPSISRFHAVVQYGQASQAFLFDLGSTHGTLLNKKKIVSRTFVPLRVGDVFRLGQSSRLFFFEGPRELMPEEGLSKEERQLLRKLREEERRKGKGKGGGREGGGSSSSRRSEDEEEQGASWGFAEDAEPDAAEDEEEVTWQSFKGELTEHQQKVKEKVQKRLEKLANLKREIDVIRAKDIAQGGLSQGQQTQIARNEQRMAQLVEEAESLEETLNESIRESLGAKGGQGMGRGGRRRGGGESDEDEGSDGDDEFFDRSLRFWKPKKKAAEAAAAVETAESLLEKRARQEAEVERLQTELREEEEQRSEKTKKATAPDAAAAAAAVSAAAAAAAVSAAADDSLDAFMSNVSSQIDQDKLAVLNRQIETTSAELQRTRRLLQLADPAGEAEAKWRAEGRHLKVDGGQGGGGDNKGKAKVVEEKLRQSQKVDVRLNLQREAHSERHVLRKKEQNGEGLVLADEKGAPNLDNLKGGAKNLDGDGAEGAKVKTTSKGNGEVGEGVESERMGEDTRGQDPVEKATAVENLPGTHLKGTDHAPVGGGHSKVEGEHVEGEHVEGLGKGQKRAEKEMSKGKVEPSKKRRVLGPMRPSHLTDSSVVDEEAEEWFPPEGQTGNGSTSLNQALGY